MALAGGDHDAGGGGKLLEEFLPALDHEFLVDGFAPADVAVDESEAVLDVVPAVLVSVELGVKFGMGANEVDGSAEVVVMGEGLYALVGGISEYLVENGAIAAGEAGAEDAGFGKGVEVDAVMIAPAHVDAVFPERGYVGDDHVDAVVGHPVDGKLPRGDGGVGKLRGRDPRAGGSLEIRGVKPPERAIGRLVACHSFPPGVRDVGHRDSKLHEQC